MKQWERFFEGKASHPWNIQLVKMRIHWKVRELVWECCWREPPRGGKTLREAYPRKTHRASCSCSTGLRWHRKLSRLSTGYCFFQSWKMQEWMDHGGLHQGLENRWWTGNVLQAWVSERRPWQVTAWRREGGAYVAMHTLECWRYLDHQAFTEENCRLQSRAIPRESLLVLQLEEAEEWDHPRLWSPDAGHRAIGVGICPTGFQSCFGPTFSCYAFHSSLLD